MTHAPGRFFAEMWLLDETDDGKRDHRAWVIDCGSLTQDQREAVEFLIGEMKWQHAEVGRGVSRFEVELVSESDSRQDTQAHLLRCQQARHPQTRIMGDREMAEQIDAIIATVKEELPKPKNRGAAAFRELQERFAGAERDPDRQTKLREKMQATMEQVSIAREYMDFGNEREQAAPEALVDMLNQDIEALATTAKNPEAMGNDASPTVDIAKLERDTPQWTKDENWVRAGEAAEIEGINEEAA